MISTAAIRMMIELPLMILNFSGNTLYFPHSERQAKKVANRGKEASIPNNTAPIKVKIIKKNLPSYIKGVTNSNLTISNVEIVKKITS